MMTLQSEQELDTRRAYDRLGSVEAYLRNYPSGALWSITVPLWDLRVLQDDSRRAGLRDIVKLCNWLEQRVVTLQNQPEENYEALIAEMSKAIDYIKWRLHAAPRGPETPRAGCSWSGIEAKLS